MTDKAIGKSCAVNSLGNTPAQTKSPPLMFGSAHLESEIAAAKERMCAAPTRKGKLAAWREMCQLIDQRSPETVAAMERARGLR